MVKHQDAFAPFSMGPFNCIGRNRKSRIRCVVSLADDGPVARMELRTLTAQLLLKYDVAFAPGEDGTRILTKTKDHFTVSVGQLDLGFKPVSS